MVNRLIVSNQALSDFGIFVDTIQTHRKPLRRTNKLQIPGRNGDLIIDDGVFENVQLTYHCVIKSGFRENYDDFAQFIGSLSGYQRIECTDDLTVFREGVVMTDLEPSPRAYLHSGAIDLTFDCKPQKWLKSGETSTSRTANGTIENPTNFASQPLLRAYGAGSFTINGTEVAISACDTYTDIDCEMMECFKGTTVCNKYVTFSGNDFPKLKPGSNTLTLGSGITRVVITPRWWKL